ncbi:GmrSD restriction endonuclease domain-containing protein [Mycoplasma sp. AC157]
MEDNKIEFLSNWSLEGGEKTLLKNLYLFFKKLWEWQVTEEDILVIEKNIYKENSKQKFYIEGIADKQLFNKRKNKNSNDKNIYGEYTFKKYVYPLIALKMIQLLEKQEENVQKYKINSKLLKSIEEKEFKNYINDLIAQNNEPRDKDDFSLRFWNTIIKEQNDKGSTILKDFLEQLKSSNSIIETNTSEKNKNTVQEINWININLSQEEYKEYFNKEKEKQIFNNATTNLKANKAGEVIFVDSQKIRIKSSDKTNEIIDYNLRNFERSNQGTIIIQTPIVKVGDKVEEGQLICVSKFDNDLKEKGIFSEVVSIRNYLHFYSDKNINIPIFQRNFSWYSENIEALLKEIDNKKNEENISWIFKVFLNNVVITQTENETKNFSYNIIDGQQRTITFYLIFIAFAKFYLYKKEKERNKKNKLFFSFLKINNLDYNDIKEEQMKFLKQIFEWNFKNDSKISSKLYHFKESFKFICDFINKKYENCDIEQIENIINFFLDSVSINLTVIKLNDLNEANKIFKNINLYTKPLEILDLLKNQIYLNLKKKNSNLKIIDNFLNLYDKTWNIYFRDKNKIENKVTELFDVFLYCLSIYYNNDFDNPNKKNLNILDTQEKVFSEILDSIMKENNKKLIYLLLEDFLIFDFINYNKKWNDEKIKKEKLPDSIDENPNSKYQEILKKFNDSSVNFFKYIKEQIRHITANSRVFIYPIFIIIKHNNIFDNKDKGKLVSELLYKLEKISLNWKWFSTIHTKREYILDFTNDLNNMFYEKKKDILSEFKEILKKHFGETGKINILDFSKLNNLTKFESEFLNKGWNNSNDAKTTILRRIMAHFYNDMKTIYEYKKDKSKNDEFIDFDKNYSYEHALPQKLDNTINEEIKNQWEVENNYDDIQSKIGNGILLTREQNSSLSNKFIKKDPKTLNLEIANSNYSYYGYPKENKNFFTAGEKIYENLNNPQKAKEIIEERTKQIFKIYFDIFNEESDNKEIENSLD